MYFLNHPITTVSIIIITFAFYKIALRFSKSTIGASYKECEETSDYKPSALSAEEFQRGKEIILKASKGELPREEYDDFMSHRKLPKKPIPGKRFTPPSGHRLFKSPADW